MILNSTRPRQYGGHSRGKMTEAQMSGQDKMPHHKQRNNTTKTQGDTRCERKGKDFLRKQNHNPKQEFLKIKVKQE